MEFEKKIYRIIPPMDYKHRNGFSNIQLINELTSIEKENLERVLIEKIIFADDSLDTLIVETLGYLKSEKALPILRDKLMKSTDNISKLIIASSIYDIDKKSIDMIDVAISSVNEIDNKNDVYYVYKLASVFDYLAKFRSPKINDAIREYAKHEEYLISYNAKRHL